MKKFSEYLEAVQENKELEVQNEEIDGKIDALEKIALGIGYGALGATAVVAPAITLLGIGLAFLISTIVDPKSTQYFLSGLGDYISTNSENLKKMTFKERFMTLKKVLKTKLKSFKTEEGSDKKD
jgi:hypothetical protein